VLGGNTTGIISSFLAPGGDQHVQRDTGPLRSPRAVLSVTSVDAPGGTIPDQPSVAVQEREPHVIVADGA
jgi:hypothetical protein